MGKYQNETRLNQLPFRSLDVLADFLDSVLSSRPRSLFFLAIVLDAFHAQNKCRRIWYCPTFFSTSKCDCLVSHFLFFFSGVAEVSVVHAQKHLGINWPKTLFNRFIFSFTSFNGTTTNQAKAPRI